MSAHVQAEDFDVEDPTLTRFDLVKEGARRDGVEIVHYVPRFPVPGTKREKRVVRTIALMFLLAGLFGTLFVVAYCAWPWTYQAGFHNSKLYTPILGLTMGLMLALVGFGMITWGKKLLPEEISVQERHEGGSAPDERKLTGQTMLNMVDELGVKRRPLLGVVALAGMAPIGVVLHRAADRRHDPEPAPRGRRRGGRSCSAPAGTRTASTTRCRADRSR